MKFLNNKINKMAKNIYYGPINIKNLVIGYSTNEINDIIIDILQNNLKKI